MRSEDGCVFDEGRVGVTQIGIENCEREAALAEGVAITRVLVKDFVKVRRAEIDGGETVSEVAAGDADDGASKQARGSVLVNCGPGASVYFAVAQQIAR